jgi:hypothetical protein
MFVKRNSGEIDVTNTISLLIFGRLIFYLVKKKWFEERIILATSWLSKYSSQVNQILSSQTE